MPAPAIAEPPRPLEARRPRRFSGDVVAHVVVAVSASLVLLLVAGVFWQLGHGSLLAWREFGLRFLTSDAWNPVTGEFGALSSAYGTLVSAAIALIIAVPMSLLIALFLVELAPTWLATPVGGAIELLAAIPSIIFGMWGLFVFAPFMQDHVQPGLKAIAGGLPLFSGPPMGIGMLTAGLVLALMVLPFIASISRDVFAMTPSVLRESAYGLGSTTWEVTRRVTIPFGKRGIAGAVFLGLGRALGETMAVTFVIGNNHSISASVFAAGNSISSTLANEFTEADKPLYLSSLIELGLVLLVITVIVQVLAQVWLKVMDRQAGSGK